MHKALVEMLALGLSEPPVITVSQSGAAQTHKVPATSLILW